MSWANQLQHRWKSLAVLQYLLSVVRHSGARVYFGREVDRSTPVNAEHLSHRPSLYKRPSGPYFGFFLALRLAGLEVFLMLKTLRLSGCIERIESLVDLRA